MAHLLIADDIAISRETLARVLREAGHRVTAVPSGQDAVERARVDAPDMAILDLSMPRMGGLQAAPLLKAGSPGQLLPVLIVSGRVLTGAELQEVLAVADDFLRKPFVPVEICARIDVWLRTRRLFEEQRRGLPSPGTGTALTAAPPSAGSGAAPSPFAAASASASLASAASGSAFSAASASSGSVLSSLSASSSGASGSSGAGLSEGGPVRLRTRGALMERIEEEWRRAQRWNEPFALLLLQWREVPGAAQADALWTLVSRGTSRGLRPTDVLGPIGPSGGGVLLPNTTPALALALAERIRGELRGTSGAPTSLAIGLALVPSRDITGPEDLFRVAELALERATAAGGWSLCMHQHQGYLVRAP